MTMQKPAAPAEASLLELVECPGVFADAALADEHGSLLFASLWGRDTALQELLARASLPASEGGITTLRLVGSNGEMRLNLDRLPQLEKLSGRAPGRSLFGDLVQMWIYDRLAVEPDRANRRALLLDRQYLDLERLWPLVSELSHLPLLPHWRESVLRMCQSSSWVTELLGHGIRAWRVELPPDEFELAISQAVKAGLLDVGQHLANLVAEAA